MLMRKPGPVNAHSFLRLKVPWGCKQDQVSVLDMRCLQSALAILLAELGRHLQSGWPALSPIT